MSDDWLYGRSPGGRQDEQPGPPGSDPDATRAIPRQPRPDETRVMPTMPRGQQSPTPAPAPRPSASRATTSPAPPRPTPPRPVPPPGGGDDAGGGGWRPHFRLRYLWILLALWLVYLIAVPFFAWSKVDKINAFPAGHRPADQPGTNYLLVGSDSRAGLSAEQRKKLHTGNAAGQRTDTIVLVHTGSGPTLTMSIPRDSIVPIPGHSTTKINAAFAWAGPSCS